MPVIGRPPVSPAVNATNATNVGAAPAAPAQQPAAAPLATGGTVPATAAADLKPTPVVINGFGGKPLPKVNITLTPTPGQSGAKEAKADLEDGGWVSRGFIDVGYQAAVGGVDIDVTSHHARPTDANNYAGDDMVVYLQARVLDAGKERVITLATMFDGVFNDQGTSSATRRFHVDYAELNGWLKQKSPTLELKPGDPLAAYAVWKGSGHQWGGFMREGYFNSPAPVGKATAVDAKAGKIGEKPAVVSVSDVQKPIDITHKVPEDLVKAYPLVLENGAKFVSRREHETKFCPKSLDELKQVTLKLLDIASGDARKKEKALLEMFGKDEALSKQKGYPISGWKIHTTDRYYAKNADGSIQKGKDGLPVVVPMFDVYQDDPSPSRGEKFPFAQGNMAVRFRDGEIAHGAVSGTMGKLNMKTPRVADPFTLIQTGLELSLDTKPGISKNDAAMQELAGYLDKAPAPYNPMLEQKKVNYNLAGSNVLHSAIDNLANRYKFTLEHESGMEIEISLDFVHAGFVFENKAVAATANMSEAEKYDHYAAFPDDQALVKGAGKLNTVVYRDDKGELVMANFWLDEQGEKHASEHPAVMFPQVEMEMDHVQARSTGPVQQAYTKPTEVKNLENDGDQDAFLKAVTDHATMNGPPTTHVWEDLKDAKLYEDHNYAELGVAVTAFRNSLFPNGVNAARQKAAQALELGGFVQKKPLNLGASLPYVAGRDVNVNVNWQQKNQITVASGNGYYYGNQAQNQARGTLGGKPCVCSIDFDGFPVRIPFSGNETAKEVAEAIARTLDKAVLYKAEVVEVPPANANAKPSYTITVVDR